MDDEIEIRRDRLPPRTAGTTDAVAEGPDREPPRHVLSRAARLRRAAITVGVVLIAVAILAVTLPNGGMTLRVVLNIPTPVPTSTPAPGAGMFLLSDGVPWGTLLVNGHAPRITAPRYNTPDGPFAPTFVLAPGRYTIEYRAAPFPTLSCSASVPAATADICPLVGTGVGRGDPGRPFAAARVLDLQARPERLSGAALAALELAVVAGLDAGGSPVPLAVGDHYPGADGMIHSTGEPLQASLVFTLNQDPGELLPGDAGPCATLCASFASLQGPEQGEWTIAAHVILSWRVTRPDGIVVVASAPAAAVARAAHQMVLVSARWADGGWTASAAYSGDLAYSDNTEVCSVGDAAMADLIAATIGGAALSNYSAHEPGQSANDGCLIVEQKVAPSGTPIAGPQAWVLYRCGAIVAANDPARALFPMLPRASAHELALAERIAATYP